MKKKILSFLFASMLLASTTVDAATLTGTVYKIPNETAREYIYQPDDTYQGVRFAWGVLSRYQDRNVTITNTATGQVVYTGKTAPLSSGKNITVTDLPIGTYSIKIESRTYDVALPFMNTGAVRPLESTFEITSENQTLDLNWVLVSGSHKVTALSKRGTFPTKNQVGKNQNNEDVNYRIWYYGENGQDGILQFNSNNSQYLAFLGVLDGDTLGLYNGVTTLPVLSQTEIDKGYYFRGWRINGSDQIFTEEEVATYKVNSDVQLEAIWGLPSFTVTFATDTEKGNFEGHAQMSVTVEGKGQKVKEILQQLPQPTTLDGYTFLGYFVDNTTNIVPASEIEETPINSNMKFYAKYRKDVPEIAIGENGNWFIDGTDTGKPSRGENGQDGVTITTTDFDAEGNNVITFSDGNVITIKNGINGIDGQDGKDGENNANPQYVNKKTGILPQTGGESVTIITIVGAIIGMIATYYLGRKQNKNS